MTKVRADEQKLHRRPSLRASQHLMTKPSGCGGQGKCSGCARKAHVLTRGDLFVRQCVIVSLMTRGAELVHQGPGAPACYRLEASEFDSGRSKAHSAQGSNVRRERAEVSKGRTSRMQPGAVKGRT